MTEDDGRGAGLGGNDSQAAPGGYLRLVAGRGIAAPPPVWADIRAPASVRGHVTDMLAPPAAELPISQRPLVTRTT
ncbi:MAG TPA: hypothetical protein VIK45_21820, partial [Candidatus Dormibacteraeota bacterium]